MVEALLTQGADPASLDRNGQTAMHLCCEHNQKECLSVVLSAAAASKCLETRNYDGKLLQNDKSQCHFNSCSHQLSQASYMVMKI